MGADRLACFKAYDIRGKVPEELDADLAYLIGRAFAEEKGAKSAVVGFDVRLESREIAEALMHGLASAGCSVIDIGLCGTEEVYFSTFHKGTDGGIMVTASHNPKGYNGMKLVGRGSVPVSGDSGLNEIRGRVLRALPLLKKEPAKAPVTEEYDKSAYISHMLSYIDPSLLRPLKIVMNPGSGTAGAAAHMLAERLPFECVFINDEPDGNFPSGVPNPLLPENRKSTSEAVVQHRADLGIAWDGDFDRCFLFDERGEFIEGYYLVGLLAEMMLKRHSGAKIIHDPRLTWNTIETVRAAGGIPVQSKTGHAFIKERMRAEDAVYGGEMSAHHYFRDFAYCDSGMIPWLLIAELMSVSGKRLSELVSERMAAYPCSGEINYKVDDSARILADILEYFSAENPVIDHTDGLSLEFAEWRMNIRLSNTEPLLRLNIETAGRPELVQAKLELVEKIIEGKR